MTDNEIGKRGVKALSEALKVNTTLTSLDMSCGEERKKEKQKRMMNERRADDGIGDEGAKSMSEMLKVNNVLTSLNLESEEERWMR